MQYAPQGLLVFLFSKVLHRWPCERQRGRCKSNIRLFPCARISRFFSRVGLRVAGNHRRVIRGITLAFGKGRYIFMSIFFVFFRSAAMLSRLCGLRSGGNCGTGFCIPVLTSRGSVRQTCTLQCRLGYRAVRFFSSAFLLGIPGISRDW